MKLSVLDLFAGIGGFSLGLEATGGFETVAFCECHPYARRVLAHHWPEVRCYADVRSLDLAALSRDGIDPPAVICGGFPCQDISLAGAGAGLEGERSGLWFEMLRIIAEVRPAWVIAENVAALRSRVLDTVLRGLASVGYDAEWHCIPAAAVGAPHLRDRIWVVAYTNVHAGVERRPCVPEQGSRGWNADRSGIGQDVADAERPRLEIQLDRNAGQLQTAIGACGWSAEPDVGRMAYGVPSRVDRIGRLGNAVVPLIPALIGRAILEAAA